MAVADGFHVDSIGNLWLGSNRETFDATTRSEAPFYVYANGDMVANSGTFAGTLSSGISISAPVITGGSISGTSGTFTGDISGASGTFSGSLSGSSISGGSININNNFIVDSSGNLTANNATLNGYLTSTSTINADNITTGTLNVGNINVSGRISFTNNTDVDSNAIVNKLDTGAIPDTKLGNVSANKISAGTLSGMFISGGSINVGNGLAADSSGMTAIGTVTIAPSSGSIGNGNNALAGNSLTIYGGGTIQGTISADNIQDRLSSSNIDFSSSYMDFKPSNALALRASTAQITFYEHARPTPANTLDLGSSFSTWRDIYTVGAVNTSDINLKTDVEDLTLGLDFLNTLEPIQYKWSDGGVRTHAGFSAQDVEQKLIDYGVASTNYALFTNSQVTEDSEEEAVYGLRTFELVSVLTKAVQELSAKNDELESRLAALEG